MGGFSMTQQTIDEMKIAQIRQEQKTAKTGILKTQTWSNGHDIMDVRPDFADQIRGFRKDNFQGAKADRPDSMDLMTKASNGRFGRKNLERFEAGYKPTLEQAKTLETIFHGLELTEKRSVFSPVLTAWEKFIVEHGGDLEVSDSFEAKYFQFLDPYIRKTHQTLINANKNRFETEAEATWNGVRKWDGSVPCKNDGCIGKLVITEASNTRTFYDVTKSSLKAYIRETINNASTSKISPFLKDGESVEVAKKRMVKEWDDHLDDELTGVFDYKQQTINTLNVRGMFRYFLWDMAENTKFGDFELDLIDFSNADEETATIKIVGGEGYNAKGAFTHLELQAIHGTGDLDATKIAHRLNICADRQSMPTCSHCRSTRWTLSPDLFVESNDYFQTISQISTQVALETILSSTTRVDSGTYLARFCLSGETLRVSTSGTINGLWGQQTTSQISDALQSALRMFGSITIPSKWGDIEVCSADNIKGKIYTATNTSVLGNLAKQLKRLKPVLFFLEKENPYIAQDEWAGKVAGQILHAIGANRHLFSTRKDNSVIYSDGSGAANSHNMLTLNSEINEQIEEHFTITEENGTTRNTLEETLSEDMNLPMLSLPRDYNRFGAGGYLTKTMQSRYPMISNNKTEELLGHCRFQPSEEAIEALNYLQRTEWEADRRVMEVALEVLKDSVRTSIIDNLEIKQRQNKAGENVYDKAGRKEYAFSLNTQPRITQNQISAWERTGNFVKDHVTEEGAAKSFFHPWTFEWRGRMMTCTTLLSPQEDDLSRGVLRFAKRTPLSEQGWVWLQRHTAALMKGQSIANGTGQVHKGLESLTESKSNDEIVREWGVLQSLMADKTWESYDQASKEPLFRMVVDAIAADPLGTFEAWGRGDVFTAKCEGFQRLSACIALSEAYSHGGIGAEVNLPVSHDASSSIYQHASALVRDEKMAKSVNVLPNDSEKPSDVYLEIVNHTKRVWEEKGNPLHKNGLMSEGASKELAHKLLTRKFAKKPVMTIGYGAAIYGITSSFLSHNGKRKGMLGPQVFVDKKTNKEVEKPEQKADLEANKKNQWWRPTAHPASLLGEVLSMIEPALHYPIANTIVTELERSTYEVLPGINHVQNILSRQYAEAESNIVHWRLADGCLVRNMKLETGGSQKVEAWKSILSSNSERQEAVAKINSLLEARDTKVRMTMAGVDRAALFNELGSLPKTSAKDAQKGRTSTRLKDSDTELSAAFKHHESLTIRPTFSRRTIVDHRDKGGEARGLSPNFIHSHDACHMRLVLGDMMAEQIPDVWSVHDAFGAHPNHLDFVRKSAVESFALTHKSEHEHGILAEMDEAFFTEITQPTMAIDDIQSLDSNERPVSKYLIS
jgi:hypothetical protein